MSSQRFRLVLAVALTLLVSTAWPAQARELPERPLAIEMHVPQFGDCPFVPSRHVRVNVEVSPGGEVKSATVLPSIAPCASSAIAQAVSKWRFASRESASTMHFTITINFARPQTRR